MSQLGQSRRFRDVRVTSAYAPRAAIKRTWKHFAFVPGTDSCTAAKILSFDNIIGAREQCRRQFETERLGGLEIDEQLNLCGLLDRQISQLFAL
jgi:hypothetical protein